MTAQPADRRRRAFGPVALLGLASAAVVAVAAHKPAVRLEDDRLEDDRLEDVGASAIVDVVGAEDGLPLAGALALLLLAGWGVLLVTRGPARRVVAWVVAVLPVGVLAAAVVGWRQLLESYPGDDALPALEAHGAAGVPVETTPWLWTLLVAAALATAAGVLAALTVRSWPEMGSRYDAPAGAAATDRPLEQRDNVDVWKSLDEGEDPTA